MTVPESVAHTPEKRDQASLLVVPTGVANLASVEAAFARLGVTTRVSGAPREIEAANAVVLPGVGSFGEARAALDRAGSADALEARVQRRAPTLAICLGMQLLCEGSTEGEQSEGEHSDGLGLVPGVAERFTDARWVPQLGWNKVVPSEETSLVREGFAYFAHSYRLTTAPPGWSVSWSESGEPFVAAFEDGGVLACQFHPELSGAWGQALLGRWLQRAGVLPC